MVKLSHISMVFLLLLLIITGLNVCNQGINSLTEENRKPVLFLQFDPEADQVSVFTLGQEYNYSRDNWELNKDRIIRTLQDFMEETRDFFKSLVKYIEKT